MPLLSIIIPVYNEAKTIRQILERIESVNLDKEIIVVDDSSNDGTDKILREIKYRDLKVIHHTSNRGKGAGLITGLGHVSGKYVIIQDADLEYNPDDYLKLLQAIEDGNTDVVLGARFTDGYHGSFIPRMGNRFLTGLLNLLFKVKLNDCFTCYKLFPAEIIKNFNLKSQSFDIEIEIITKAIKNKLRIKEIPISYQPRTYKEGKKIRWKDGVYAILSIIKYRLT